jgi:hypothetical protein
MRGLRARYPAAVLIRPDKHALATAEMSVARAMALLILRSMWAASQIFASGPFLDMSVVE